MEGISLRAPQIWIFWNTLARKNIKHESRIKLMKLLSKILSIIKKKKKFNDYLFFKKKITHFISKFKQNLQIFIQFY